jgi:hypothetical protein
MGAPNCQTVSSATANMAQPGRLTQPPVWMPMSDRRLSTVPPSLKTARHTRAMDIDAPSSEGA